MSQFALVFWILVGFWGTSRARADESVIRISAVGDVMIGSSYPQNKFSQHDGLEFFGSAATILGNSDINFANFEGTFFVGRPQQDGKSPGANHYLFQTPPELVERLQEAHINVVSLANNHAHDFGATGFRITKATLAKAGIQYSSKDGEVASFEIHGTKLALIALDFYPGRRSVVDFQSTLIEIDRLKRQLGFDIIIVSAHVGAEGDSAIHVQNQNEVYLGENRGNSISFAHAAVDAGADLILMHGPHVPRAIEIYRHQPIVYSLGNFATSTGISLSGHAAIAPLVSIDLNRHGQFLQGQIYSFHQERGQGTQLDPSHTAQRLIQQLSASDFPNSMPHFLDDGRFTD